MAIIPIPDVATEPIDRVAERGVEELERWLAQQSAPAPRHPIRWSRLPRDPVRDVDHLSRLVGALRPDGFGIASSLETGAWGQTMRVAEADEYVIEVSTGSGSDFARRVFSGPAYPPSPVGERPLHDFEVFPARTAAAILWAWVHGGLPAGYDVTLNHFDAEERRRYRLSPDD